MDEISVSASGAHYGSQGTMETIDKPVSNAFGNVDDDFLPPVSEGGYEFSKVLVAGEFGFANPSREQARGFLSAGDFLEDTPEFFLEQIQRSKLGAQFQCGYLRSAPNPEPPRRGRARGIVHHGVAELPGSHGELPESTRGP
jgi:hypothetical protein